MCYCRPSLSLHGFVARWRPDITGSRAQDTEGVDSRVKELRGVSGEFQFDELEKRARSESDWDT